MGNETVAPELDGHNNGPDNVGIGVADLSAVIDFFRELGFELEGRATIEGE